MTFRQLLMSVRESLLQAYERQVYPFEQLIRDLSLTQHRASCPLFRIALLLEEIHAKMPDVKHDLEVSLKKLKWLVFVCI